VAPHHLEAWQRLHGRATVVAIADPNVEAARARAKAYGVPAVYPSVATMLEREKLDAVDVATPRETHAPICRLAADRGLAIICQKPLAPTFAEAASLVADVGGRVRLMVHENWRFRPLPSHRPWLRDGRVGGSAGHDVALHVGTHSTHPVAPRQSSANHVRNSRAAARHGSADSSRGHARFLLGPLTLAGASIGRSCPLVRSEDRASMFMTTTAGRCRSR
jgi:hypothetical protein